MNAVEDVRYRQSSQFRFWSHTRAELASLRTQTNTLATTQISNRLTSAGAGQDGQPLPEFLTAAEELDLLKFFTVELLKAGEFCKMPTEVRATAAIFFRRFYVTNSVMTYSPTDLTKTCLFFGAKGEGQFHTLSKFAEMFPNTKAEEILAGEFLLCQGIRFCFDVRHPFRALDGAVLELNRLDADKVSFARQLYCLRAAANFL
jgi:cyclin H